MSHSLLAGPILRRVTANRVCVWFASTHPIHLKLQVLAQDGKVLGESQQNDKCRCGQQLFVYLLQARCNTETGYPLDTFLHYRLSDAVSGEPLDLSTLTYDKGQYPKFFIPNTLKHLLHGSCRKPHGGGESIDALSYGDTLLQTTHHDIEQRPGVLLLSGDQIYSDDVAIALLAMLKEKGQELLGREELLPLIENAQGEMQFQNPQTIPLHTRKSFLAQHHSGFTSGESQNHLLAFGEFAAMYIYAFGNAQNWAVTQDWQSLTAQLPTDSKILMEAETAFKEQQNSLQQFQATLPNVRRLLANIPTYMIFDDHDVTDDWNITNDWYREVRTSPLGQRIVANALAAYWAFQGWGNDADNFDKDLQLTIHQYLMDNQNNEGIAERYDLHTWKHRGWGFSVPTQPPIIAIDSRTQRMATQDSYLPILLDRYARDWLRVEWAKLKTGQTISAETCPIFIATTPVLGFSVFERAQKFLYWAAEFIESYKYVQYLEGLLGKKGYLSKYMINLADIEAWTSNKDSFLTLMNCLSLDMKIKQCVFLSGDVHYAFSALGKYTPQQGNSELCCYQLVSTSLKNSPDDSQLRDIETASRFGDGSTEHTTKFKELLPWLPLKAWVNWVHLLLPKDSKSRVHAECNLGLVTFENGKPVVHTLLSKNNIVYPLPDCTTFTFEAKKP